MQLKEAEDLIPLALGFLTVLTGVLCAAHWGTRVMTWLVAVSYGPRHRAPEAEHHVSVGGQR